MSQLSLLPNAEKLHFKQFRLLNCWHLHLTKASEDSNYARHTSPQNTITSPSRGKCESEKRMSLWGNWWKTLVKRTKRIWKEPEHLWRKSTTRIGNFPSDLRIHVNLRTLRRRSDWIVKSPQENQRDHQSTRQLRHVKYVTATSQQAKNATENDRWRKISTESRPESFNAESEVS